MIVVLCDDRTEYNEALNYFYTGAGAGSIDHTVYQILPGLLGQFQESGRDQGHNRGGTPLAVSRSTNR